MDFRQIKVSEDDFGLMTYDPAFTNTASCRSSITYIDGEAGVLEHRGYPIEQLCEHSTYLEVAYLLDLRRAAHPGAARRVDLRDHPPHLRPREHQEVRRGLPLRRPPDGDAARHHRRALDLLPGRQAHRRGGRAPHGGRPPDREDADAGRLRLPPQPRAALRLSGQRPVLPRQLPLDDVQDDGGQVRAGPAAGEGARRALDPARRPRAELLDQRGAQRRLLAGRPLLGGGGRRGRALRPAAWRRERGRAAHARPDRHHGEHPRLPRGREEARGEADGVRPPRLQELRPACASDQGARGRGLRGDRPQPEARHRRSSWRSAPSTTTTSSSASSTQTSTSTRG